MQKGTSSRYLECGILAYGFARAYYADCGRDFLVAFACKGHCIEHIHFHCSVVDAVFALDERNLRISELPTHGRADIAAHRQDRYPHRLNSLLAGINVVAQVRTRPDPEDRKPP